MGFKGLRSPRWWIVLIADQQILTLLWKHASPCCSGDASLWSALHSSPTLRSPTLRLLSHLSILSTNTCAADTCVSAAYVTVTGHCVMALHSQRGYREVACPHAHLGGHTQQSRC